MGSPNDEIGDPWQEAPDGAAVFRLVAIGFPNLTGFPPLQPANFSVNPSASRASIRLQGEGNTTFHLVTLVAVDGKESAGLSESRQDLRMLDSETLEVTATPGTTHVVALSNREKWWSLDGKDKENTTGPFSTSLVPGGGIVVEYRDIQARYELRFFGVWPRANITLEGATGVPT